MAASLVVFLIFAGSAGVLAVIQRLSKKPLPVGCTQVDGQCCRQPGSERVCDAEQLRRENLEVRNAGA